MPHHPSEELKKHINKPVTIRTVDGKAYEGILGHVDGQIIHIQISNYFGPHYEGNFGHDHVGDIYNHQMYGTTPPAYMPGYPMGTYHQPYVPYGGYYHP